ncbi:MAG: PDZ domain-containing protein [Planctomycetota bacterium]|nr:MAG: PDZ domain-containing protein [Planctomycetota bacterium]
MLAPPQSAVPFEQPGAWNGSGPIVFSVDFDGTPAALLLDTGASRSVVDADLAERLDLEPGLRLPAGGVGGVGTVGTLTVPRMSVGGLSFTHFPATSMDMSFLEFDGRTVDGIFGSDLLRDCRLEVDFAASTLRFQDLDAGDAPEDFDYVTLGWFAGIPLLPIEVCGIPAQAMLDTGNMAMTTVHGPFFREHFQPAAGPRIAVSGVGGEFAVTLGRLRSVTVAGTTWSDVAAVTPAPDAEGGLLNSPIADANVGVGLLRHYRLLLDYPNGRLGFAPGKEWPQIPRGNPGFSVRLRNGVFEVRDVFAGSDAEAAGLQRGDHLTAIDGKPAAGLKTADLLPLLHGEPGTRLEITFQPSRDGSSPQRTVLERRDYAPYFEPTP